jgi:dTDP-4-dehydrorhamnose reductase
VLWLQFKPHCVVNCAAMSQPGACEQDYAACCALNVPDRLVAALQQLEREHGITPLLVHLSTDQVGWSSTPARRGAHPALQGPKTSLLIAGPRPAVRAHHRPTNQPNQPTNPWSELRRQVYDGSRGWWSEADATQPVNAYGRSKLMAEQLLAAAWPGRHVVLRSSLMIGPEPPLLPVQRPRFLQFIRRVLQQQQPTSFFVDEWRCAVLLTVLCCALATELTLASNAA